MRNPFRRKQVATGRPVDLESERFVEILQARPWPGRDTFSEPDEAEKDLWRDGKLVPAYISFLLDSAKLFGPAVDAACNAVEPEVDLWEIGRLYPRWDQTVALAKLLDVPVRALAHPDSRPEAMTSRPMDRRPNACVVYTTFEPDAVERAVRA